MNSTIRVDYVHKVQDVFCTYQAMTNIS